MTSTRYMQDLILGSGTMYYPLAVPGAQTFFVAPSAYRAVADGGAASLGNTGESVFEPLSTIAKALELCVAGRGDTIVLMPGVYTLTAALAVTKSAVRIVSLKPYAATITGDGVVVALLKIDADDVEVAGVRFAGVAAAVTLVHIADTTASKNTHIHHCKFIGLETVAGVTGIINGENGAGNDAPHTTIEDCSFEGLSAQPIWTFGGGARILNNFINLDDTAAATGVRIGDMGAAFGTRKAVFFDGNAFVGQTDASSLLAVTIAGTEANTQMWCSGPRGNAFASCAAPTAAIHPEGAAGPSYVGTATTVAPTLWPA